ncbi:BTAD domain-containing putative transcriptional regulator [Amycolatopsis sp. PS_44_ISF1]|uniref:AfsR/SARP family transcriptional regulator n=1 Tax=Amycolatopsis sp. PS_44_ISF1 TaxID=2974917 RepID=UPI0028DD7A58|nr:BTAD domain-containing putative transcriptional regulator [Amycolatopsis sp. PS_44_ISF1]MDT8912085.1 tetratricopeptide repeat protein [Amycolatopsis sp. PS_44_ISF1]
MAEGWRFRLLGPLEVRYAGVSIPVAAAKQRVLIAVLALAAGEPVTVERLIACLWNDVPPSGARNTLQNHVLRLRRTLAVGTGPGVLVSSSAGYRLNVDPDLVDVHCFRSLVRSARSNTTAGEAEAGVALLDEALRLWRGEPLADVPSDLLHRETVPALAEARLAAREQRIALDLDLGRHRERVGELVELTNEHPLQERLWAQLMLALYRSGRTAEALDAYRRAGQVLAEELGVDPGPELHALHQAVLANDPTLAIAGPASGPTAGQSPPVPRQLPPLSMHFVGRAAQVRDLDARWEASNAAPLMVISAIGGTAGIGKTALALHWGHARADRFPDGQLYVNLRGFDPAGIPLPPMTAVRGFLTALGVPMQSVPADPDDQVALYRSHLAGRRILVVLDNARDAEQVRPLLPGAPGCLVLVTSRDQMAGLVALDGAVPLTLDVLTYDEAFGLLVRRLGQDRVTRERAEADELIEACARLPLAVNIAAARAALHPDRPLAAFVGELRDAHRRLDVLTTGDAAADVRVVFSWSYRTLSPEAARVFRLMGANPGPDVSLLPAAGLTGQDPGTTRRALDELTRAHLISEHTPGRYTMHDLLRTYAADQASAQDGAAEEEAALRRVVDFYVHTACRAECLLNTNRAPIPLAPPAPGVHLEPPTDARTAMAWHDAEYTNLLAAQEAAVTHGWHLTVWQLAWSLNSAQFRRGNRAERLAVWQAALEASTHLPDPGSRMHAHRLLGGVYADLGRHNEALVHLRQSLALAEEHQNLEQQAETHRVLARAWRLHQDYRHALVHSKHSLELHRALGQPVAEAMVLNQIGWQLAQLGEFEAARANCEAALAIQRLQPDPARMAPTLDSLGYILHHSGRHQEAVEYYEEALALVTDLGHLSYTADVLDNLGHSRAALEEHEQARTVWRRATELYWQHGYEEAAERVQRQLDALEGREAR